MRPLPQFTGADSPNSLSICTGYAWVKGQWLSPLLPAGPPVGEPALWPFSRADPTFCG